MSCLAVKVTEHETDEERGYYMVAHAAEIIRPEVPDEVPAAE